MLKGSEMPATAIWIPLPLARSGATSLIRLSTKGGTQPLFDNRKIAPQKEGSRVARPPGLGDRLPPTRPWALQHHPHPWVGVHHVPARGYGRVAYLRPGAPVAYLLLLGQPTKPRLRGLSRAWGTSPAPTSARQAGHQPGTAHLPRAGSGCASAALSARACVHTWLCFKPARFLGRWAGTATGSGRFYLGCPATSARAGLRIATRLPSTAKNFVSKWEESRGWWGPRAGGTRGPVSRLQETPPKTRVHLAHCDLGFNRSHSFCPRFCQSFISYKWKKFLDSYYPCSA